jgi:hypothetical protein
MAIGTEAFSSDPRLLAAAANRNPALSSYGGTTTTSSPGGATQDRLNIDYLLNPYYDTSETRTNAAEANLGQGVQGSGFGSGTTNRLLESERIQRFQLGHQMLEPYLQRDFQAGQAAAERQARLNEIAAQGAQALQQLQLSEAGQTARLNTQEAAALQRQVLSGQQAMQQLGIQQAGENTRTRLNIGGNILNTLLTHPNVYGGGGATTGTGTRGYNNVATGAPGSSTPNYITEFDWASQTPISRPNPNPPVAGGTRNIIGAVTGLSTIDSILRRYGLTA